MVDNPVCVKRIAIVGPGGAGKSRLAVELGQQLGIKVVYLDRLFWKPGWVPRPPHEWDAIQREQRAGEEWIVEGLTGSTIEPWLREADTVVLLDLPLLVCIWRVTRRRLNSEEGVGAPAGCEPAPFHQAFLKFLRRLWHYRQRDRPAILDHLERRESGRQVYVIRNSGDSTAFFARVRDNAIRR